MRRFPGIVMTGAVSGTAYFAAQAIDIAVTGNDTDDQLLVGAQLPVDRADQRSVGTTMHILNSMGFAGVFRLVGRDLLAGPMWLKGMVFALIETVALFPLVAFERHHPAIRDGRLRSYRTPVAFAQQLWRHAALGVTLGLLTPRRK